MMNFQDFTIVGENIHCTRKVKRGGKRTTTTSDGREAITYESADGTQQALPIPERLTKDDSPPLVAHVRCAIEAGLNGSEAEQAQAAEFIQYEARRQADAGAAFLDVNVDELSNDIEVRNRAMQWVVPVVQSVTDLPLSIDSSAPETLRTGLEAYDASRGGRPMLNSVSLERPATAELAAKHNCHVIVLPVAETGMPVGVDDRLSNVDALVEKLKGAGIALEDMYVDPLVLAASTDPSAPQMVLETIRQIRAKYPAIHIAGGHTNVSHGLPMRRLLNAVWLILAIEAGSDSGILDPVAIRVEALADIDRDNESYKMAEAGLLGKDDFFMDFITAAREGRLSDPLAGA